MNTPPMGWHMLARSVTNQAATLSTVRTALQHIPNTTMSFEVWPFTPMDLFLDGGWNPTCRTAPPRDLDTS